jgi:L-iditol 2-dehydrogenase
LNGIVLRAPNDVVWAPLPEPHPANGAVVRLEQVGICGTDVKIVHGDIPVEYPRVLGHELIGRIEQPGPRGLLAAGTRVLVDPAIACGHCRLCRSDRANLCPNGALLGRDVDGGFAERIAVDELQLHAVPESIGHRAAGLLQVLGTCVHAQSQIDARGVETAAVIGLGVAGLLHLQLLRARGIRRVVGVARSESKRKLALELGATSAVGPEEAEQAARDLAGTGGVDLVVEAVGTVPTLAQAIRLANLGGAVLLFGTVTATAASDLPFYQLYFKELRLLNPRAALPRDYDRGIAMAAAGELQLEPLWSRSYPLADAATAFRDMADVGGLKVTLDVP